MIVTNRRRALVLAATPVLLAALLVAAPLRVARAQGTAEEWSALVRRFEQQVKQTPSDPSSRFTLAMLYARIGRVLDGFKQLQEADQAIGSPAGRLALARQTAADAEGLLIRNRHDLLARYRLAFARYFLADHPAVAAEFERIVASDPQNDWGYGYLGQAYANLGQLERAIVTWERGLAVNPRNSVLHYVLGLSYTRKGDKKKAAAHLAAAYRDRTLYDYITRNPQ